MCVGDVLYGFFATAQPQAAIDLVLYVVFPAGHFRDGLLPAGPMPATAGDSRDDLQSRAVAALSVQVHHPARGVLPVPAGYRRDFSAPARSACVMASGRRAWPRCGSQVDVAQAHGAGARTYNKFIFL